MQNHSTPSVTVRQFYESMDPALNLALASSGAGLDNSITSPRIQKLGLGPLGIHALPAPGTGAVRRPHRDLLHGGVVAGASPPGILRCF